MQFGDRWLSVNKRSAAQYSSIGLAAARAARLFACSDCSAELEARAVDYRDGPGAGRQPSKPGRNTRRASDGSRFMLGRPSSVSRALQIIGDKWSFMVVREAFLVTAVTTDQSELASRPTY